ncbi:putative ribonuclease H-like domain-containing protein [Tanacetum coccineum]
MEAGTSSTTLTARLPILNPEEYDLWLMRIEQYFLMTDYSRWEEILNGNKVLKITVREVEQEYEPTSAEEMQDRRNEMKARGTLLMALPNKDQLKFHSYKDAKLLMEAMEKRYGGNKESKKVQRALLKQQYENFAGSSSETMDQTFDRNKEETETISLDDLYNNLKIYEPELTRSSSTSQNPQNVAFVSSNNTNSNCNSSINEADNIAYGVSAVHTQCNPTSGDNLKQIDPDDLEEMDLQWEMVMLTIRARRFIKRTGRKLYVNGQRVGFDKSKVECYNCHKNGHFARECRAIRNQENKGRENSRRIVIVETPTENALVAQDEIGGQVIDKFKTGLGYNTASSTAASPSVESFVNSSKILENQENNKSKFDKGYHAVPPPYIGNFIPFKPDLTFMDEIVESENIDVITVVTPSNVKKVESNHESVDVKNNGDAVEPKTVRKNSFRPLVIKDWNSDDDSEGNPQQKEYKEKRVIDSGCSRHMTGNKCYLTEYEDYDGGFVSFGDGKGRIYGKGKIKTGTLDFDNVYFCTELKYNLFSVSQICDKKNNVLFTDTECLVLSSDFKLLDESQVLLRVPRKDNIYSVDLKSIVPTKGLTCLFAKATIDESNLWHRRLGHINFKNMNKLVRGNLVRGLPLKIFEYDHSCIACQKGKQHKVSCKAKLVNSISKPLHILHMDLFGPINVKSLMKKSYCLGIKREFSVARTPQQNGVAKRRNRTLIEVARTMLVDSKLPTTFWAEAVNTACYVLNRVLVIKPHTKTPYELISRRTTLIDFMKPFGCPVTILNTRDNLGKFDGKADEGFFVGYFVFSKAMRVFNKRTRIVEETLNIRFLENAPNVTGNGPDWLFDIDSLTISMNYVPVVTKNQTNGIAGTRDNNVTGQAEKKTKSKQEYILIPFCTTEPLISQGPKDSEEDSGMKPIEVDVSGASDKDGEDDQATRSEFERLLQQEKQTVHPNSTNSINTVSTPVSTAGPSFTNDAPSSPVNAARTSKEHLFEQFSPFKNAFTLPDVPNVFSINDTGIFCNAYDDEDVGAEADLNNLETTMNVSPIPTTRIDKDHPKDQIIRDLTSAIQTRRMTKIFDEHAMKVIQAVKDPSWIEAMQEELLQFQLQKVWTLVNLPNGQRAIRTKWVFRNKKDERGIVIRNKARQVAQGYTQE